MLAQLVVGAPAAAAAVVLTLRLMVLHFTHQQLQVGFPASVNVAMFTGGRQWAAS